MKKIFLILFVSGTAFSFLAKGNPYPGSYKNKTNFSGFVENKGQIIDQHNRLNPACRYLLHQNGLKVQLRKNGFSYEMVKAEYDWQDTVTFSEKNSKSIDKYKHQAKKIYHTHRVDIDFMGANPRVEVTSHHRSRDYANYYTTGTSNKGALQVHHYGTVVYENIYQGIDVEFTADKSTGVKYNIIVHPGGNPDDFRLGIQGADAHELNQDGSILINTAYGEIREQIPHSYISETGERVKVRFKLLEDSAAGKAGTVYGLEIPDYDQQHTLVIDPMPNRNWGTYFGGSELDEAYSCITDGNGNVYLSGGTNSLANIASSGAHQVSYGGGSGTSPYPEDAFLAKFNSNGQRQWATYYGGSETERGFSCATDGNGNVYLAGTTKSTTNIATIGSYQDTFAGGDGSCGEGGDAFLVKFSSDGVRQWGTYFGGSDMEDGYSCSTDNDGNVYLAGKTSSNTNIATTGAHQDTLAGYWNAFLVKFNDNGQVQWGTYYGGNNFTGATSCANDAYGNVHLVGYTSCDINIASSGSHQDTLRGNYNSFLVKFDNNGVRQWGTYYGGDTKEFGLSCAIDKDQNVFLSGRTWSGNYIATPGAQQENFGGGNDDSTPSGCGTDNQGGDAFLVKFSSSGIRQWGTYYGGSGDDKGNSCTIDGDGNIYLAGRSTSHDSIATPGAYQDTLGDYSAAFLVKFNGSGERQWGTYYGAEYWVWGHACAVDGNGRVYLAGETASTTGIASTGAHQDTLGGSWDAFLVQFDAVSGLKTVQPEKLFDILPYPNPSSGAFYLRGSYDLPAVFEMQDIAGKTVWRQLLRGSDESINVVHLPAGIYLFRLDSDGKTGRGKIVLNR